MANMTVARGSGGKYTIESTIPKFAVETLNIQAGDLLEWDIEVVSGQKVLIARKAEKSGTGV